MNEKNKRDETALRIAVMLASQQTDNFPDSIVRSAEIYKKLTGEDRYDINSLRDTRDKVLNKKKWYQFWR